MSIRNKKAIQNKLFVFWDTETEDGFIGESICSQHCTLFSGDETEPKIHEGYDSIYQTFEDIYKQARELKAKHVILYAHNASYDLMRTKDNLPNSQLKIQLVTGQMVAGVMFYRDLKIECRDSMRLLPQSLAKLAQSLTPELPKLDMNHLTGYEIGNSEHQEYAKRDVVTLRAILKKFASLIEQPIDKLKFSAAGQAFALFRSMYGTQDYRAVSRETNEFFLKHVYVGGRIYIRNNHNPLELNDTISLDETSAYPTMMQRDIFPLPGKEPKKSSWLPDNVGRYFVKVKVSNYESELPIIPYRVFDANGETKTTFYPLGSFTSYLSDHEHEFLKKQLGKRYRLVVKEIQFIYWDKGICSKWLKPYIDKYYQLKAEGDRLNNIEKGSGEALRTVAKLFLNSLYGKFAQKYVDDGGESISFNGGEDIEVFGQSTNDHRNAHISAFITASARVALYEAVTHYGASNVIYCDTDSIKVLKNVYESCKKLPTEGDFLGSWKPEGEYRKLQVIAPKVYLADHDGKLEIKAKGLPMKGITAVAVNGTLKKLKRSTVSQDVNDKVDKLAAEIIRHAAYNLSDIKVYYGHKPNKLKTFTKTGEYATTSIKTMSKPEMVTGMYYDGDVYKFHVINEDA